MKIAIAAAALTAMTSAAFAHGAAIWIQNGGYTAKDGKGCCGPDDCHMEMSQDVIPIDAGWLVKSTSQSFHYGDADVFPSIDAHYWTCRREAGHPPVSHRMVKCLFVPTQS